MIIDVVFPDPGENFADRPRTSPPTPGAGDAVRGSVEGFVVAARDDETMQNRNVSAIPLGVRNRLTLVADRLASGFYDRPAVLGVLAARILDSGDV